MLWYVNVLFYKLREHPGVDSCPGDGVLRHLSVTDGIEPVRNVWLLASLLWTWRLAVRHQFPNALSSRFLAVNEIIRNDLSSTIPHS